MKARLQIYASLPELQTAVIDRIKTLGKKTPVVVLHDLALNPLQWRSYSTFVPRFITASHLLQESIRPYQSGQYINETIVSLLLTRLLEELSNESEHPLSVHARELLVAERVLAKTIALRAHEIDKAAAFAGYSSPAEFFASAYDDKEREKFGHILPIIDLYHRLLQQFGVYDIAGAARTFYKHLDDIARTWAYQHRFIIGIFPEDMPAFIRAWWDHYLKYGGSGEFFALAQPGGVFKSVFRHLLHHESFSPVPLKTAAQSAHVSERAEIVREAVRQAFLSPLQLRSLPKVEGIYIYSSSYWLAQINDAADLIADLIAKGARPERIALIYPQNSAAIEYEIGVALHERGIPYLTLSRTRYDNLDPLSKSLLLLSASRESIRKAMPHFKIADEVEEVLVAIAYLLPSYSPLHVRRYFFARGRDQSALGGIVPSFDVNTASDSLMKAIHDLIRIRRRLFKQGLPLSQRIRLLCSEVLKKSPWRLHDQREEYIDAIHFASVITDTEAMLSRTGLSQDAIEEIITKGFFSGIIRGPSTEHIRQEEMLSEKSVTVATPYAYIKRATHHEYHIWLDMSNPQWTLYETNAPFSFYNTLLPPEQEDEEVPAHLDRQSRLLARLSMHAKTISVFFAPYTLSGLEPEMRLVEAIKTIAYPLDQLTSLGLVSAKNKGTPSYVL